MEAAGDLIGAFIELSSGVKIGHDDFESMTSRLAASTPSHESEPGCHCPLSSTVTEPSL